jgi:hypothetical protein
LLGLKTKKPGEVPGFFALWVVDRSLCGVGVMIRAVGHRIFAEPEQGRIVGDAAERLPEQDIGHDRHRLAASQTLAVKRADYVVGKPGRVQVSWHGCLAGYLAD